MKEVRRVVRIEDVPLKMNAETSGNPKDQGCWKSLIGREYGSKDLALGIGWLKPGEVHPLHHHDGVSEFYYILEGSGRVMAEEEETKVLPGTAIYIPAGQKHQILNDGKEELVVLFGYNRPEWRSFFDR